jgi:transcriptional regulator with XRE-family HTH domain
MTDPPLPAIIRAAIAADGRPIRQIAIAAGLDSRTVQRYASGERDLTSERLGRLMGALGLAVTSPARAAPPIAPIAAGRRPKESRRVADLP